MATWHHLHCPLSAEKYEDLAGTVLPPETQQFLDAWKRPEELVQNSPNVPMLITQPSADAPPADDGKKGAKGAKSAPVVLSRDVEGVLFAGHKSLEWLQGVFYAVLATKVSPASGPNRSSPHTPCLPAATSCRWPALQLWMNATQDVAVNALHCTRGCAWRPPT